MGRERVALTDGGIETVLLYHEGFELPCFASFPLLEHERGRAALRRYFEPFLDTAQDLGVPFVLDTATWRANPDWGAQLGYDLDALAAVNRSAVRFAEQLAEGRPQVTISGLVGPRGDGYVVVDEMTGEQVETDGRLPSGTTVADAIDQVDDATGGAAEFFMINCAHPTHIAAGLDEAVALGRVGGVRVNASALSHAELDEAEELDAGDPALLARENAALRDKLPSIQLLGGCCGTDHRHVTEIIAAWNDA